MAESWSAYLQRLTKRGKLTKAIVCKLDGTKVEATPSCDLAVTEACGIIAGFHGPVYVFKIFISDVLYRCHRVGSSWLLGQAETSDVMFAAVMTGDFVVVGFCDENADGSSLHEIQRFHEDEDAKSGLADGVEENNNEHHKGELLIDFTAHVHS